MTRKACRLISLDGKKKWERILNEAYGIWHGVSSL